MIIRNQKTISRPFTFLGVGLHSGTECKVTVMPAKEDSGVRFISAEDPYKKETLVDHMTLDGGVLGTNVVAGDCLIKTVEHFLAAVSACSIDNLLIEVAGGEIPIMDGSSMSFVELLVAAGEKQLSATKNKRKFYGNIRVEIEDKYVEILERNDEKTVFDVEISFENQCVQKMPNRLYYEHSFDGFNGQLANARTFGFQKDLDHLLVNNLCLGGSLNNAILFNDEGMLNPDGLRFSDEIVCHKTLDIVGDLSPLINEYYGMTVMCYKPGHYLNNLCLKKVFLDSA